MEWMESDVRVWNRSGRFYVIVPGTDGKWKSSGRSTEKDAIRWALTKARGGFVDVPSLADFARDFFVPGRCGYISDREDDGELRTEKYWRDCRQVLEQYLLPRWGAIQLDSVRPAEFHQWLKAVTSLRKGTRLSSRVRKKIQWVATTIWNRAVFLGASKSNPIAVVPTIVVHYEKRRKFTAEEREAMFPCDLASVWRPARNVESPFDYPWAIAAMLNNDLGLRPQETLALYCEDYDAKRGGILVSRAINEQGLGGLKTSSHGVDRRVVRVTPRLREILEPCVGRSGPMFTQKPWTDREGKVHRDFLRVDTFGKIFCKTLDQPRRDLKGNPLLDSSGKPVPLVRRDGRTLYGLRHSKNTELLTEALRNVQTQMGHTTDAMTANYDDADLEDIWKRAGL